MRKAAEGGRRRAALGPLAVAAALAALGLFMLWETYSIPVAVTYARVGPRVFPVLVASALLLSAVWLALEAWRSREPMDDDQPPVDWSALAWVSAGLLAEAALLERIGFVLAATLLFMLTARGFGSRAVLRDAAIAMTLALVAFLGFTLGLGLSLPPGPFAFLI